MSYVLGFVCMCVCTHATYTCAYMCVCMSVWTCVHVFYLPYDQREHFKCKRIMPTGARRHTLLRPSLSEENCKLWVGMPTHHFWQLPVNLGPNRKSLRFRFMCMSLRTYRIDRGRHLSWICSITKVLSEGQHTCRLALFMTTQGGSHAFVQCYTMCRP